MPKKKATSRTTRPASSSSVNTPTAEPELTDRRVWSGNSYRDFDVVPASHETVVKTSDDLAQLFKALVGFQKDLAIIGTDSEGFNYNYLSLGGLLEVVSPIMAKHSLGLSQFPVSGSWVMKWVKESARGELIERYQAGILTYVFHSSGQYMQSKFVMPMPTLSGQINTAQETGAGITYARRYAICAALRIATDDTDAAE